MTRLELLRLVVARARTNGFELRRWYTLRLGLPWISTDAALTLLDAQRRYYALLFSHEFASAFWKAGADITFAVPAQSYQRPMPDGTLRTVERKGFIRRSARPDAWRYHLQQMAIAEDPLRHLRKYMHIEDALDPEVDLPAGAEVGAEEPKVPKAKKKVADAGPAEPTLPNTKGRRQTSKQAGRAAQSSDLPTFLKRPYKN